MISNLTSNVHLWCFYLGVNTNILAEKKGFNAPFNLPMQEMCIALENIFYAALLGTSKMWVSRYCQAVF